ncbi:MAG: hypothetical protein ABR585_12800 [Gemmatimonadaceae bacterium]|nr:hypothetical protein [Actinomycetota bacterium]
MSTTTTGSFRLTIVVGNSEVPAHLGNISRDKARHLKKVYAVARPEAVTRVRRAA